MTLTSLAERARQDPATVCAEIEKLYAAHTVARVVAEQLGVGVATLKRVIAMLEEKGHVVRAGRRRGNPTFGATAASSKKKTHAKKPVKTGAKASRTRS